MKLPKCTTFNEIMIYYQGVFNRHAPQAESILKTDCYNEITDIPVVYRPEDVKKTFLIEYEQKHIDLALEKNPKLSIFQGDIRKNNYRSSGLMGGGFRVYDYISFFNYFDFIFDVSTLDHIPQTDIPKALDNYYTMLRNNGTFALVTWFNKNGYKDDRTEWNSTDQYYFDFDFVKSELEKRFTITNEELVMDDRLSIPGGFLYLFEAKAK